MRYIIFDLDGTLARSGDYEKVFIKTCARIDISADQARKFWHSHQGLPLNKQFHEISGESEETIKGLEKYFWDTVGDEPFVPVEGAEDLLRQLQGQGRLLFLTTGSIPARLNQCLDQLGWIDFFYLVQGSDDKNSKGPEHYKQMADSVSKPLSSFVQEAVMIGDGAYDMSSARDAGIPRRIGYLPPDGPDNQEEVLKKNGAKIIINQLSQLSDLLWGD